MIGGPYWVGKKLNFQAVIKSAAQPPRRPNPGDQAPGERPKPRRPQAEPLSGAPLELGPLDLVFEEAALAADLITA